MLQIDAASKVAIEVARQEAEERGGECEVDRMVSRDQCCKQDCHQGSKDDKEVASKKS